MGESPEAGVVADSQRLLAKIAGLSESDWYDDLR
jgi:hypothetical protein